MKTMSEIIKANRAVGQHWFARETVEHRQSKTTEHVYDAGDAGTVFVISEAYMTARRYRPCLARPDGRIVSLMDLDTGALEIEAGRDLAVIAARLLKAGASTVVVYDRLRQQS